MGVKSYVKPWEDVYEVSLDEALAPSLYEVYFGEGARIYVDPWEFFRRTYLSPSMRKILTSITDVFEGIGGRNLYPLFSLYGGGKTHTLITIYHAIKTPEALLTIDGGLAERLIKLKGRIRLAMLDCESERLVPNPLKPLDLKVRKVKTIWGALADQLGRYDYVRSEDEALVVPTPEALRRLFEDSPTIILIDEVAKYSARFQRSSERQLQNYGKAVVTFIENLSKAVQGSKTALLITLPIEIREEREGQRTLFESALEDVLPAFFKGIQRITSMYDRPLTVEDVVEVLRRRVFQQVDANVGSALSNRYISVYSSEHEMFQERGVREGSKIGAYYPFHPSYVEILYDLVTRVRELEKTRDAIRITRKVVRHLWESGEDPDLIMPWHIDLTAEDIGSLLVTSSLKEFQVVLDRDLKERIKDSSKPKLAKAIATSIFLKTYTYGATVKAERVFPRREDIFFYAYEQKLLESENARIVDIGNILDELYGSTLLYLQEQDGRYWFSPFLNIIELVIEEANRIDDANALSKLKEYALQLLTKPPEEVLRRRARREELRILDQRYSSVFEKFDYLPIDVPSYVLVVYLEPLSEGEVLEAIYNLSPGKPRNNKNTICLLYPESAEDIKGLLIQAKRLIACDKISGEIPVYFEEEMRPVASTKLNSFKSSTLERLLRGLLASLNQVAYPIFNVKSNRDHYDVSRAKTVALSLMRIVEETLVEKDIGKIASDLDFDRLNYTIKEKLGIELSEGSKVIPVSELISYFYTNPRLPFTKAQLIREALEEGVRRLKIGVQKGEEVFWKRVYSEGGEIPLTETGNAPPSIDDVDLILPWRIALEKFLEDKREEKVVTDLKGKRRIWYIVRVHGEELKISDLTTREGYEEIIKLNPVIQREITIVEDFDVVLGRDLIVVEPEALVESTVKVEGIGEFKGEVGLSVDYGSVNPKRGTPTFEAKWILNAPEKPGDYAYKLIATVEGPKPKRVERTLRLTVRLREALEWVEELKDREGYELDSAELKDYESFTRAIAILTDSWVEEAEAHVSYENSIIELKFKEVEPTIVAQLIKDSLDYLGTIYTGLSRFSALLRLRKPVKIGRTEIVQLDRFKNTRYRVRKS